MDSGNSGSIQSSSGGDEEFDSRGGESISSFLNNPLSHFGSISTPNQPFLTTTHQNPTFFNPQNPQIILDHHQHPSFHQSNPINPHYNDLIWSRGLRSHEPNYGNLGNITTSSSSISVPSIINSNNNANAQAPYPTPSPAVQTDHPKNPKKRTRASRRAPTTVLTTDTTNFRQMVQEFTGIPAAPFTSSPYARRLDLFSAASAFRSGADGLGSLYPLRPSPHKVISPFSSGSSPSPSLLLNSITPAANISRGNNNNSTMMMASSSVSTSKNPNNYPSDDHLLINLQQQQPLNNYGNNNNDNNISGFQSHETSAAAQHDNFSRWAASGDTVLVGSSNSNVNDGNLAAAFHANINNNNTATGSGSGAAVGYNLNLSDHKALENNVAVSSGPDHGNVSSWICTSD